MSDGQKTVSMMSEVTPKAKRRLFSATVEQKFFGPTMATFEDMASWTERLGNSSLRAFTDSQGHFWLEQNAAKRSKWAVLAKKGHHVAWEFEGAGGSYTGRMLINGGIYTVSEATKKFLRG